MTPEELKQIIEETIIQGQSNNLLYILGGALLGVVSTFGVYYLRTKAKNYATKQDIKGLTKTVEDVKIQYAKQLEFFKGLEKEEITKLYKKTRDARWYLIKTVNPTPGEIPSETFHSAIVMVREICMEIASNILFEGLKKEGVALENELNKFVQKAEKSKILHDVSFDDFQRQLRKIQDKIIEVSKS